MVNINIGGSDLSLDELKSHLDALGITKPVELDSLRIMWRKKFKYLSSLEWKNNDDLNKALQEIETSYDYLRKISFSNIDGLSKTHYKFLFEQSKREEQVTGQLSSEDINNRPTKTSKGKNKILSPQPLNSLREHNEEEIEEVLGNISAQKSKSSKYVLLFALIFFVFPLLLSSILNYYSYQKKEGATDESKRTEYIDDALEYSNEPIGKAGGAIHGYSSPKFTHKFWMAD